MRLHTHHIAGTKRRFSWLRLRLHFMDFGLVHIDLGSTRMLKRPNQAMQPTLTAVLKGRRTNYE